MKLIFETISSRFLRSAYAENLFTDDPPDLLQLGIIVARVLNFFVLSAGVVFVALILISAYKFAMAQGDPKGFDGAKKTLTYAVLGFLIVVGVYGLLSIIVGALGATSMYSTPGGIIDMLVGAIRDFSAAIGITDLSGGTAGPSIPPF